MAGFGIDVSVEESPLLLPVPDLLLLLLPEMEEELQGCANMRKPRYL
jgi:hypothetical protein